MRKTAVDYLFEKLWTFPRDKWVWQHYLEKAEQMEKEQIKQAYWLGQINYRSEKDAEQYYQEKYEEK